MITDNYIQIHPMVNRIGTIIPYNVMSSIDTEKEIFHNAGEIYTSSGHSKLFSNPIENLFIAKEDRKKYYQYLQEQISVILNDPMMSLENKAEIVYFLLSDSAMDALEYRDSEYLTKFKNISDIFIQFALSNPNSIKAIIHLTSTKGQDFNHLVNVGIYGVALVLEISNSKVKNEITEIASGFFFHDIGKSFISEEIKEKKTTLTEDDWKIIRQHPEKGYNFLKENNFLIEEARLIVLQHHERHNGSGYPGKLTGTHIHTFSKICSIADSFDALSSNRPYRKAQSTFKALEIMQNEMKDDFDPKIFSAFAHLFTKHN